VAFATILAVVAGLALAGASAISHDLYARVIMKGQASEEKEIRVSKIATLCLGVVAVLLGMAFEKMNVAFMVALAFGVASCANFPVLLMSMYWKGLTTRGALVGGYTGLISSVLFVLFSKSVWVDVLGNPAPLFPYTQPALFAMPLAFWPSTCSPSSTTVPRHRPSVQRLMTSTCARRRVWALPAPPHTECATLPGCAGTAATPGGGGLATINARFVPLMIKRLLPFLLASALIALGGGAHAERADRSKPMNIEADALHHDELRQTSVFTGRVVMTKGSIVLRGERLEVRQDPQGYQSGTVAAAPGQRAFFRQRRDAAPGQPEEFVEGEGETIEYDGRADTVKFIRRASCAATAVRCWTTRSPAPSSSTTTSLTSSPWMDRRAPPAPRAARARMAVCAPCWRPRSRPPAPDRRRRRAPRLRCAPARRLMEASE